MSNVRYNAGTMTIEVDGLDDVSAVLGDLRKKTPAVAKVAINATARQARKLMIAEAKARYAVNSAGKRHLSDLVQRKKASNSSLSAELRIASYRNDLGYFQTRPNRPFMGHDVAQAPEYFTARVLKTSPMKPLTGKGRLSKGFLVEFKSGHVGMVQRIVGTGRFHYTVRSGAPSTSDKMQTMGSPSAAAMHSTIWPEVEPEVELFLAAKLTERAEQVLARAKRKARGYERNDESGHRPNAAALPGCIDRDAARAVRRKEVQRPGGAEAACDLQAGPSHPGGERRGRRHRRGARALYRGTHDRRRDRGR
jgi:hypothetical protein